MKLEIFFDAEAAATALAERIIALLEINPTAVLGLATGATMEPVYAALVEAYRERRVSFAGVTSFNLDEYIGLPASHPGSYRSTMNALLFDHVDIDHARTFLPDGMAADSNRESVRYEDLIRQAGGIDFQILGIGRNGHVGFNEPGSTFDSRTRAVELHTATLTANAGFFPDGQVPESAITMGIGTILDAREICVLATGESKADALAKAFAENPSTDCPASALKRHGRVTWLADNAACGSITERA